MSEWQSIETAPKDGSQFIAFFPDFRDGYQVRISRWQDHETREYGKTTYHDQSWDAGTWMGLRPGDQKPQPSHWMPLPLPPINPLQISAKLKT